MKFAALTAALALGCLAQEVALRAGVARSDITPSTFGPMYGYANRRCGPANGAHDQLHAKALVLEAAGARMAIVTLDLGSMVSATLFRRVADELKIPLLLLAASHTHSAPAFLPSPATGSSSAEASPYLAEVEAKIFDTVARASQSMFPAKLAAGRGSIQLGYNRLLMRDDGRARALFDNLDRIPYGPVDPEFLLLRVSDGQGNPRALIVHYAAHAVVLGPTSCKYSADYPGVLQSRIEESIAGVQAMFVQGGAGDINPLFQGRTGNEEADFTTMRKMGEALAAVVLNAAKSLQPVEQDGPFRHATETISAADRWEKGRAHEIGIATVLVNREIAIAAIPGEPMHRLQTDWKSRAEVKYPLFYGYTQTSPSAWPGYIPDLRTAAYGGYGADVTTRVEVGTAERIVNRHVVNLYGLRGMWRDQPGRP